MLADPDHELISRIAAGDAMAARTLMTRHLPMVLGLARRLLTQKHEADDVAQEVFTRVWTHAAKWTPGQATFKTWLHRVAMNLCYDRLRARRHDDLDAASHVAMAGPGPAQLVLQEQAAGFVDRAIASLPSRQREAIVLVHYQGLTNIEASAQMEVSVEALESLLARGRRALKDLLRPLADDLTGPMEN
jgi:RNA polymerase sigma-70 factor (ECF subfamily)